MHVVLKLQKANEKQARSYILDDSYTLNDVQEVINLSEQLKTEITFVCKDGSHVEFDVEDYRTPPAVISVLDGRYAQR